jgi:hypothetical protein
LPLRLWLLEDCFYVIGHSTTFHLAFKPKPRFGAKLETSLTVSGVRLAPSSFALVSEQKPNDSSTLHMSEQRSNWRERLHANPSRMEQELAIKPQDDGIHYQTQVELGFRKLGALGLK